MKNYHHFSQEQRYQLEVYFWSSRSNTSGRHITLEIVPNFYSLEIIQKGLSTSKSQIAKGLIIWLFSIFKFKHNDKDNVEKVRQIYGDVIGLDNIVYGGDIIRDNHNCNIYGIDEFRFNKTIEFIDNKILYWVEKTKTSEEIIEFIEDRPKGVCLSLLGEGFNSDFVSYRNLKFPELKVEERLRKITNTQHMVKPIRVSVVCEIYHPYQSFV